MTPLGNPVVPLEYCTSATSSTTSMSTSARKADPSSAIKSLSDVQPGRLPTTKISCNRHTDIVHVYYALLLGKSSSYATNFGALPASSLQNDQNTKSVTSLRNIICFYCPLLCLKWIYIIYELKMYAVWWSVNKSIPQSFSMNRVLCRYSLTILSIHKSSSFM